MQKAAEASGCYDLERVAHVKIQKTTAAFRQDFLSLFRLGGTIVSRHRSLNIRSLRLDFVFPTGEMTCWNLDPVQVLNSVISVI